jgi:hypothetical protein
MKAKVNEPQKRTIMTESKKLCLLALICMTCTLAQAQQIIPGFKGGLNVANLSNTGDDNRISGHIGFFLHTKIARGWAFQPEILYSGQGDRYWDGNTRFTTALNYIDIPLMFQFYPIHRFYLEFGPQLGILVAARDKGPGGYNADVSGSVHKTDATLNLGMGVRATDMLGFYMRYGIGLSDVSRDDNFSTANRVFQLGVDVRLQ